MMQSRPTIDPSASSIDADGVRRLRTGRPVRAWQVIIPVAMLAGASLAIGWHWTHAERGTDSIAVSPVQSADAAERRVAVFADDRPARAGAQRRATPPPISTTISNPADDAVSGDPNDLASYFAPGDPVPSAAEVIQALQESGDHTGLGAFNPPGTSPPLRGLAVPESFVLPPGYVRHHQVTDQGEPLEPILMFSPDLVLRDAAGEVIPLPDDLVVPPELAPPGLPLRPIDIPTP
jgi:hypothetical protein